MRWIDIIIAPAQKGHARPLSVGAKGALTRPPDKAEDMEDMATPDLKKLEADLEIQIHDFPLKQALLEQQLMEHYKGWHEAETQLHRVKDWGALS